MRVQEEGLEASPLVFRRVAHAVAPALCPWHAPRTGDGTSNRDA